MKALDPFVISYFRRVKALNPFLINNSDVVVVINPFLINNLDAIAVNNPFLINNSDAVVVNNPFVINNSNAIVVNNPFVINNSGVVVVINPKRIEGRHCLVAPQSNMHATCCGTKDLLPFLGAPGHPPPLNAPLPCRRWPSGGWGRGGVNRWLRRRCRRGSSSNPREKCR